MRSEYGRKLTPKVHFLLLLMFLFICRQFVTDGLRIHDLASDEPESCIDISFEDNCSLESNFFGLEDAEDYLSAKPFRTIDTEIISGEKATFFTSIVHEVYLGLNTPPPEQAPLLA